MLHQSIATLAGILRPEMDYLLLAAVTKRVRVPLTRSLIEGRGCSDTCLRIALIERCLAHFPATPVRLPLADREFTGAEWPKFLNDNNIPFAIRLKENLRITTRGRPRPDLARACTGPGAAGPCSPGLAPASALPRAMRHCLTSLPSGSGTNG